MTRVISALVGLPLVVAAVFLSGPPFFRALVLCLASIAIWEYLRLCGVGTGVGAVAVAGGSLAAASAGTQAGPLFAGGALLALLASTLVSVEDPALRFREAAEAVLGMVYIGYAFGAILLISDLPRGRSWILIVLAVLWAGDTAAYYGGRRMGRIKFAPLLSPNKTWEGSACGLAGSIAAGSILAFFLVGPRFFLYGATVGLVVGACGQLGDLIQSLWKRAKGVKDSGRLIPGHGGILDRIDSLLLGMPVGWLLLRYWVY